MVSPAGSAGSWPRSDRGQVPWGSCFGDIPLGGGGGERCVTQRGGGGAQTKPVSQAEAASLGAQLTLSGLWPHLICSGPEGSQGCQLYPLKSIRVLKVVIASVNQAVPSRKRALSKWWSGVPASQNCMGLRAKGWLWRSHCCPFLDEGTEAPSQGPVLCSKEPT